MYHLYSLGLKNAPNVVHLMSGPRSKMAQELSSRRQTDKKNEYAIYNDRGKLVTSTYSGGASPHSWGLRSSGASRKYSGLSAYKRA